MNSQEHNGRQGPKGRVEAFYPRKTQLRMAPKRTAATKAVKIGSRIPLWWWHPCKGNAVPEQSRSAQMIASLPASLQGEGNDSPNCILIHQHNLVILNFSPFDRLFSKSLRYWAVVELIRHHMLLEILTSYFTCYGEGAIIHRTNGHPRVASKDYSGTLCFVQNCAVLWRFWDSKNSDTVKLESVNRRGSWR